MSLSLVDCRLSGDDSSATSMLSISGGTLKEAGHEGKGEEREEKSLQSF